MAGFNWGQGKQAELARLRDELSHREQEMVALRVAKDYEIAVLRAHIAQLNGLLTTMGPNAGAPSLPQYNGASMPTAAYPMPIPPSERYTASVPIPMSAPPAQDHSPAGS